MMQFHLYSPQFQRWQMRLARVPRRAWMAIFIGIGLPLVILGLGLLVVALFSAMAVLTIAGVIVLVKNRLRRLRPPADDGRRNVRIIVHSARVIDP